MAVNAAEMRVASLSKKTVEGGNEAAVAANNATNNKEVEALNMVNSKENLGGMPAQDGGRRGTSAPLAAQDKSPKNSRRITRSNSGK